MIQDSILRNASTHLQIRIFGNDDQVVHPSVIDFKTEHGMESWNGYRYWMALTPYPYGNSSKENPCLCVSNDGLSWEAPRDIINPLDVARGGWIEGFHSDTDMIYNPECDELWIYYRFLTNERYVVKLIRLTSDMKVIGPNHIIDNMADEAPWKRGSDLRSMAIWRESAEQWHMWAGTGERWNHKNNKGPCDTVYLKSADGITWSEPEICLNDRGVDPFQDIGYSNWHISAKPNHEDRKVEFLCYCDNMSGGKDGLIYAVCDMSNPTHIICPLERPVLIPSDFGWDSGTLYRSSFVRERRGKDSVFRVWYSASSKKKLWQRLLRPLFLLNPIFPSAYKLHARWHIGYTEGLLNK
jgi:hypothetical protein